MIWDYSTNTCVKSFEMCDVPVRCARFISRKQWFVAGTDDMQLRVYNYNTMDKIKEWEAHTDYIRNVEIHPSRSLILSSSDDMTIKCWDWDKDFECVMHYEGHSHYVMMVKINPRDTNTFASASLDRSIKIWGLTANTAHFSLEGGSAGHERGVNCIDYYPGGDKPYLLSGADDKTIKIWDYQTKACLQTLEGHAHNVSAVLFHHRLPLIVSASEDGTVRLWHATTYRPETTLNYGLERAWCLSATKNANKVAIGYDEGTIVLRLGNEKPVASLDTNTGKLVWALGHDIQTAGFKGINKDQELVDGEKVSLSLRDLGACEIYPQMVSHNCNGHFIVVCGDGEYIIYTSQALRNKAFGSALDFCWSALGTGDYAVRESISRVKIFKNFKEQRQLVLPMSSAEGLFGGHCLGVRGSDSIVFFDWDTGDFIRKIDVSPDAVYWNEGGDAVVLACSDSFYVLRFNREAVNEAIARVAIDPEEGIQDAFEVESSVNDVVGTSQWVGDCFLYTNSSNKLNYFVGGEVMTLVHLDESMYLLGFVPREDRVFLIDKAYNVVSYKLLLSVLNYQTAVVRGDFEVANSLLPAIPASEHNAVARFLESQGFKEEALQVTSDPEHKLELAIDLRNMEVAHEVLLSMEEDMESIEYQNKWRRVGDLALGSGDVELARHCAEKSGDMSGLLLLYSCAGDREGMLKLGNMARKVGRSNVAFIALFVTGQVEACIDLLLENERIPEAAFFARTYMPSRISDVLEIWKSDLSKINEKAAEALADPAKYSNLFPDLEWALKVEDVFKERRDNLIPATSFEEAKGQLELDLIEIFKSQAQGAVVPTEETNGDAEPATESIEDAEVGTNASTEEIAVEEDPPNDHDADAVTEEPVVEALTEAAAELDLNDLDAETSEAAATEPEPEAEVQESTPTVETTTTTEAAATEDEDDLNLDDEEENWS